MYYAFIDDGIVSRELTSEYWNSSLLEYYTFQGNFFTYPNITLFILNTKRLRLQQQQHHYDLYTYLRLMIFLIQFSPRKFGTYSVECWKLSNLRNTAKISHFYAHCWPLTSKCLNSNKSLQKTLPFDLWIRHKITEPRLHLSHFENEFQMEFWQFHNAKVVCSSFWLYEKNTNVGKR